MIDVNTYIGVPYLHGGRDRQGWDCFGLVKALYAERGVVLPDWYADPTDLRAVAREMMNQTDETVSSGRAEEIFLPEDWAIVMVMRRKAAHHMGVCFEDGVLHAVERLNTHFDPWDRFNRLFGDSEIRLFRWRR